MRNSVIGLVIFAFSGCASAGSGGGNETVPVYLTPGDVPCEYEAIRAVSGAGTVSYGSSAPRRDFQWVRQRILGRAGARVGASAVIVAEPRDTLWFGVAAGQTRRVLTTFEGQAVRYVDPTCQSS